MRLPDSAFAPGEDRPELVLDGSQRLRQRAPSAVMPAGGQYAGAAATRTVPRPPCTIRPTTAHRTCRRRAWSRSFPQNPDPVPGSRYAQIPAPNPTNPMRPPEPPRPKAPAAAQSQGMALFQQGEAALKAHDATRPTNSSVRPPIPERFGSRSPRDACTIICNCSRRRREPIRRQPGGPSPDMANQAAAQQQLLRPSDRRRPGPPRIQRQGHARHRSQGCAGDVGGGPQESRNGRTWTPAIRDQFLRGVDRAIARDETSDRPEPSANRVGRQEQSHPPGRRTAAAGESRSASRRSPC